MIWVKTMRQKHGLPPNLNALFSLSQSGGGLQRLASVSMPRRHSDVTIVDVQDFVSQLL